MHPMNVDHLTVNDLTLAYTACGRGRPLVLVHGHSSAWSLWERSMAGYLQEHYRCYALDLPGHGCSDKPGLDWYTLENFTDTLGAFCRALNVRKVVLIGHSMGGMISLNLALTCPALVDRLILVAPVVRGNYLAYLDPLLRLEGLVRRPAAEHLFALYRRIPVLALLAILSTYAHPRMLLSSSFRREVANLNRCTAQSLFGSYKAIRRTDLTPHLGRLRSPTLVLTGDKDRVVPPDQARLIAAKAPGAELVIIPGAGHILMDEVPQRFDEAVRPFLDL
jgi:pimeloyl-ACP methyl ester carboxylesterase